jgi:sugar O-acyltransferase (sialic acid O-acetyltransferase NeuD family)
MFAIFGTGGFGRELIRPAREMLGLLGRHDLTFVCDDPTGPVEGIPVIAPGELNEDDTLVIAVGDPNARREIAARMHCRLGILQSPNVSVGPSVKIGEGSILCDHVTLTACAKVGRHFHANIYSYVAHDCVIGDFVTFAPRVSCNGNVTVGDGAYIGTNAMIKQGVTIGENAVIGMGAVVTKDVPANITVVGNPAKARGY